MTSSFLSFGFHEMASASSSTHSGLSSHTQKLTNTKSNILLPLPFTANTLSLSQRSATGFFLYRKYFFLFRVFGLIKPFVTQRDSSF
jgi:hypothetical protein